MKFEESTISRQHQFTKKTLDFGQFYFFNKFIIAEMNYGIHLDWSKIQKMVDAIILHYGANFKIGYISNKTNSYSYEPTLWDTFYKNYDFIIASVSVCNSDLDYFNATMEKHFSKKSLKRTENLEDSISWVLNLEEFKK